MLHQTPERCRDPYYCCAMHGRCRCPCHVPDEYVPVELARDEMGKLRAQLQATQAELERAKQKNVVALRTAIAALDERKGDG